MMDLTRLEETEPFGSDDYKLFMDINGFQFGFYLGRLHALLMEEFGFAVKGKSFSFNPNDSYYYFGDLYLVYKDTQPPKNYLDWDKAIKAIQKEIQQWRWKDKHTVFHLTRWTPSKDDLHHMHLVLTNDPKRFKTP